MSSQKRGQTDIPIAAPERPGLLLRMVAAVLLSPWVLARVHRHEVRLALASLAVQAGRPEIAALLQPAEPKAPPRKKHRR